MKGQAMKKFFVSIRWYIPVFLLGSAVSGIYYYHLITPQIRWAHDHPKEIQWTIDRYNLFQKASTMLFFEEEKGQGVTIVKPGDINPTP
jgi:hypothetical protein